MLAFGTRSKKNHHSGRGGTQKTDTEYSEDMAKFINDKKTQIIIDPSAVRTELKETNIYLKPNNMKVVKGKNDGTFTDYAFY